MFAFCTVICYNKTMIQIKNLLCAYTYVENFSPSIYFNHAHFQHEILLFMRGQASFNIMGKIYPLCPMDLIIIPPGYYHAIHFFDNQYYERVLFNFDIDYAGDEELEKLFAEPVVINTKSNKNISDLFDRFNEYRFLFTGEDFQSIMHACCLELLILLKLSKLQRPDIFPLDNPVVTKILEMISTNIDKPLTPDFFAEQLFLSPSYIKNLFSKVMHVGLKHYINNIRILKAQNLLKNGHKPMDIYRQCGFESYTTFYREYKKFAGNIPSHETEE